METAGIYLWFRPRTKSAESWGIRKIHFWYWSQCPTRIWRDEIWSKPKRLLPNRRRIKV